MIKTKYRIISDGWKYFLEYEEEYTFLWAFTCKRWTKVPKPFYEYCSVLNNDVYYNTVNDYSKNELITFAKGWPLIDDYLVKYRDEQAQLVKHIFDKKSAIVVRSTEIIYL